MAMRTFTLEQSNTDIIISHGARRHLSTSHLSQDMDLFPMDNSNSKTPWRGPKPARSR
jgi:hypothetical protein